jgi:hypothetical protein
VAPKQVRPGGSKAGALCNADRKPKLLRGIVVQVWASDFRIRIAELELRLGSFTSARMPKAALYRSCQQLEERRYISAENLPAAQCPLLPS